MSDSTAKRSRKSKLVPRKYVDNDDENIEDLQQKPSTSKRKKGKKNDKNVPKLPETSQANDDFEALIDSQKSGAEDPSQKTGAEVPSEKTVTGVPPSPLKFSVTVAVEEFDESSSELMIVEPENNTIEILSDSDDNDAACTKSLTSKNASTYTNDLADNGLDTLVIDREDILNETNKILEESTEIADKILSIEVRNYIGQFPIKQEYQESKLTKVFVQWEAWQKLINQIKYRSSPLFYKCYICELSWWYLHDFQEHLKCHDDYNLDLEEYTIYEANVIAYACVDDILDIKHFYTEGDCPKCGNEYAIHKSTNRSKNSLYSCKVKSCYKLFNTCFALRSHEYMYHTISELTGVAFQIGRQGKNCEVCGFIFHSQESYQTHMDLMHRVRSDLIVPAKYRKCNRCKAVYGWNHLCKNSVSKVHNPVPCRFCFRSFLQAQAYRNHMNRIGRYRCKVCSVMLTRKCLEAEHSLKHSDKFTLVKKCGVCDEFNVFLSDVGALRHIASHYYCTEETFTKYCSNILIPKSCLTQKLALKQSTFAEEESKETIPAAELEIKREADETFENQSDEEFENKLQIKEEIDIEDNFAAEYLKKEYSKKQEEDAELHARIFGVKIEASDIAMKQEADEEEYEDDIIKLDYNFLENMQQSMDSNTTYIEGTEVDMPEMDENTQGMNENTQEMDEESEGDGEESADHRKIGGKLPKIYRCNRCGYDGIHKEYRAHLKGDCKEELYERDYYPCTKCSVRFDCFEKFIDHFSEHNLNSMACPECYKIYETYEALQVHLATHIRMTYLLVQSTPAVQDAPKYQYRCKMCPNLVDKKDFFVHWEQHLSFIETTKLLEKVIERDEEKSAPIDKEMLDQLIERLQSPEALFRLRRGCPICLRYFDRKNDYKRHLVEHLLSHAYTNRPLHTGLKCQICPMCFPKPDQYKKHMRDHGCLKDYRCEICDKNFSDSSNFTKHKKLHNANAFTCDICRKKFQIKVSLERHMEIHLNQKPIKCELCNKYFYVQSAYKKHFRLLHEKDRQKFACIVCRKRFYSLKEKWDHLWLVHKERKHKADCPRCDNSYRRFRDLKNHMKEVHNTDIRCLPPNRNGKVIMKEVIRKKLVTSVKIPAKATKKETLVVYV